MRASCTGGDVVGVGVGIAGPTQSRAGKFIQSPNTTIGENVPIREMVNERTGLQTIIHNDANAAMFGEIWKGAAHDADSAFLITLGTGIGGGIVVDGEVFDGGYGVGAELGHVRLSMSGPKCALGTPGCFESLANAPRVVSLAQDVIDPNITDSKQVYDLAKEGNKEALAIWEEVGRWIGIAVGNYINIINPKYCLIGGNMAEAWEFFEATMFEEAKRSSYPEHFAMAEIKKAQLGNDAGVFGMAHAVFDAFDK